MIKYIFKGTLVFLLIFVQTKVLAGSTISSSITLTQSVLNGYTWPVTINGGSLGLPIVLTLGENVTLTNAQNYFIINGNYVTIEGNNNTITISGISFYTGLVKNGFYNSTNGFNDITIQNLGVLAINSDVAADQGWIGQSSFALNATNNLITNCFSNGPLRQGSGGIVGSRAYCSVIKSYSTGSHIGGYAGGIFGEYAYGIAENCFSLSPSFGNRGGGIFGGNSNAATATNCYSTGIINDNCGGIFGGFSTNCTATNCYSSGSIGSNAGGIFGGNSSGGIATNCYIANSAWSDVSANAVLTGTNGTVWNTITSPYRLIALATVVTTNTTIDQAWINSHLNNLPILLGNNVTITISENLIFNDASLYFAIRSTGVTLDGNGKTITISNISNYWGLVNNGNYLGQNAGANAGSVVEKVGVISSNSTLKEYCGWIGQSGYGNGEGFSITNCYSTGNMENNGTGGILGSAYMNGTITNCYSLGNMSGASSAGIAAAVNSTASKIYNCYANGIITGSSANGICQPGRRGGAVFMNSYSSNGTFNTTNANNNLIGTDGTVWNTSVTPYTLVVFPVLKWGISINGKKTQDNSIQLDLNGKKASVNPINENGKIIY